MVKEVSSEAHQLFFEFLYFTVVYRVILVVSDWVMLTQFRLRITSK